MKGAVVGVCLAALLCGKAMAQEWKAPRTPDGKPDLQGVWTNASLTTLERPPSFKTQAIPPERAKQMEQARAQMMKATNGRTNPNEGAPTDRNANAGYNTFWIDPGTTYGVVNGETRSSWIVDPPDGRIPYTKAAKTYFDTRLAKVRETFDGPEIRPQGERCIVGFGSTGGPPMVNVLYNNHYQIVQTPTHVVITAEMVHDSRVIPIGDSYYVGEHPTVTERFSRVGEKAIHYEFTVEEKDAFTQPWRGEMTFRQDGERMYEYACHEGNYALPGILAGARRDETRGIKTVAGDAE
jgi:hypothetical protein